MFGKHETQFHNACNRNKIDKETLDILEKKAGFDLGKIKQTSSDNKQQIEIENKDNNPISLNALEKNLATLVDQNQQILDVLKSLMEALR